MTRSVSFRRLLLLIVVLSLALAHASWGQDREQIMEYYRTELWDVPVLVFCSGDPQAIGPKFLSRLFVEYLPLSEYPKRKDQVFKVPTVFLVTQEDLKTLPPECRDFAPQLGTLKPNDLYLYHDTKIHVNYEDKARKVRRRNFNCTRVVFVAPTVEWLERSIAIVHTLHDFLDKDNSQKRLKLTDPMHVQMPVTVVVAGKAAQAVPELLARGSQAQLSREVAPGGKVSDPVVLRDALRDGYRPPLCFVAEPGELDRYQEWLPIAEEVYLLTHDEIAGLTPQVRQRIPFNLSTLTPGQTLAVRKDRDGAPPVTCLVGPTPAAVRSLAQRFQTEQVPIAAEVKALPDLRQVKTILVTGGSGVTNLPAQAAEQLERVVADTLGSARIFQGVRSGQTQGSELKAVLNEMRFGQSGLTSEARENLKVANADALLLVTIAGATGNVSYTSERKQITPDPAAFGETEPSQPSPTARQYGFAGPRVYPQGENDPKYRNDLREWQAEHNVWQQKKQAYEASLRQQPFDWSLRTMESGQATVQATIRVFDLASGAVVWASAPIEITEKGTRVWKDQKVQAIGVGRKPDDPETPPPGATPPEGLVSQAVTKLGAELAQAFRSNVLLPGSPVAGGPTPPPGSTDTSGTVLVPAVEGAVGRVIEARADAVVIKGGTADGVKVGDILMVITEVEVRKDTDGTVLDTIEKGLVPIRVVKAYQKTSDCVPVKAEDLAALKPAQPVRTRRDGDPGP